MYIRVPPSESNSTCSVTSARWFHWMIRKVNAKIQTWLGRDKGGNQLHGSKEEWTAMGAGCYHNLLVGCRSSHRRLGDGGQMSSGCFVKVSRKLLLHVRKWRTGPNIELEHWRRLRCCLLLKHRAGWCHTEIVWKVKAKRCKISSSIHYTYLDILRAETLEKHNFPGWGTLLLFVLCPRV